MKASENINELATALSKAQSEIEGASRGSVNPFYKSKYADLYSVWEAIREPLTKNGLSVVQTTEVTEKGFMLITILCHQSGQWISGEYPINPSKEDPQALGSAISYARRYAIAAITGLYQKDDDGEAALMRRDVQIPENIGSVENSETTSTTLKQAHICQWLPSKFNKNEEYCPKCKNKRRIERPQPA